MMHSLSLFLGLFKLAVEPPLGLVSFILFLSSSNFSRSFNSSLICLMNSASLGITQKFSSGSSRGSFQSTNIQSKILSSTNPNCSIFCFITVLQQMYRGFSSKDRPRVYLKRISSSGQPSKSSSSAIYCFSFSTSLIFSCQLFLVFRATSDQGSSPFIKKRSKQIRDQRSSLLLTASPRLHRILENSRFRLLGSVRLIVSGMCSSVWGSLKRDAPEKSTMNNLPCFSPAPSMRFFG